MISYLLEEVQFSSIINKGLHELDYIEMEYEGYYIHYIFPSHDICSKKNKEEKKKIN